MNYFIDAGANNGCSARVFRKKYDPTNSFHIYSFEIDPDFKDCFIDIPNLTFINKAVWVENGVMPFYRSGRVCRDGGTLLKEKITGELDLHNPIQVETIDFSEWFLHNFNSDDYIILKMDIEGAEYVVLEHMLDTKAFALVDELWIEWHYAKVGISKKRHDALVSRIKVPMQHWAGLEESSKIL